MKFLAYFILSCGPMSVRIRSFFAPVNLKALCMLGTHCPTVVAGKQEKKVVIFYIVQLSIPFSHQPTQSV